MLLDGVQVVLVKTRFPENIGMAARACANMGCPGIRLVAPERWDRKKAAPLATPKGQSLLDNVLVSPDLAKAVAASSLVLGTTARTGGWRQALFAPGQAAREVAAALARGESVSLVFGPEDRGLNNEEITHCQRLVTIPTDAAASSLNLAQAVLLLLYECANAVRATRLPDAEKNGASGGGRAVNAEERERLMAALKEMLLSLDYLHGDNPDYFLMPWRRMFSRAGLRRHEYDALMGLCRQVRHKLG
ncbi:RNA methyltransferase [uncultured Desulfovibrio sp.]|uniref:RNA methyltransferase n=1 Tax=uncultured Desulfovibrio sp. TaxID=167968 RepID=UPI0026071A76|nr:RNA methyltransferase [uncultured Desulfovibrio sp.]